MKYFRFILYSFLRLIQEFCNILCIGIKSIDFYTAIVYSGILAIGASSIFLHSMARNQNKNYIEIMNHSASEYNVIFNYKSWYSEDRITEHLLEEFRNQGDTSRLGFIDSLSNSSVKSPTLWAYLYLTSVRKPDLEDTLLDKLCIGGEINITNYLNSRYLVPMEQNIKDGDYYSAHKLINRYLKLYGKYYESKPLNTNNNYLYLIKLLLQDRWALSCNRDVAQNLFLIAKKISLNEPVTFPLASISSSSFDEYLSYIKGIELLKAKHYSAAFDYYKGLFHTTSSALFKEYSSFIIIRCAFWIFDRERSISNKKIFMEALKTYAPYVESNYFKVDIEYYKKIVSNYKTIQI